MATKNPNGKKPGSSRKFRKLYLENWRNFPRAEIDLGNRVFFIGPNASGKSNLLDAFRFLRDIVSVGAWRGIRNQVLGRATEPGHRDPGRGRRRRNFQNDV